ncbi:Crp/Fnr family transcriptional regulator [Sphingosinicella terrae]|jgi:CRP-like cAMP-binding protein|uniref:Crp/Fnr family transcriptional regulator n=1 Tax=Sphingosinicella terrae TaxID=2172047 RepID=UPI000E0E00B9|nr:Crp/Fnr family transcriptional regulator [Sphingosinicella terrae]
MTHSNQKPLSLFLGRLLRRSELAQAERQAVLGLKSQVAQVRAHRDIVLLGDQVNSCCLVVDGLAARFDQLADGRRQLTALHIPGDICDLQSVVAPVASWGIEALTTTTVLHVPHAELKRVASEHPGLALAFWRDTIADASILAKWVVNLGRKSAQSRIAHLLCEMGVRMEQAGLGRRAAFAFDITQNQLADAMGLTAVHVNRTLQAMRGDALVRFAGRTVELHDWDRLARIAEFDPAFLQVMRGERELVDA